MVYVDRIHGIVFRLETVAAVFFVVGFYGGGVVDKGDNDISVFGSGDFRNCCGKNGGDGNFGRSSGDRPDVVAGFYGVIFTVIKNVFYKRVLFTWTLAL